ncbi:MAG: hypothetical protein Q7S55_03615 [Nanoarchaeota archaeon]|nr:hypothetical protein [Nanoarchaeota archaeon]
MGFFGRGQGFFGVPRGWNVYIIGLVALILAFWFKLNGENILSLVVIGLATIFAFIDRS